MGIYATFSAEGVPTGFYDEGIHGAFDGGDSLIPASAIAITTEQWRDLVNAPGRMRLVNGITVPFEPTALATSAADIDLERNRRIAAGFMFNGKLFQAREQDLRNINGAATGAALAMMQGAQAGNPRWQGGDSDFGWIAADNDIMPMDVLTMIAFGRAAMTHVERLTMVGRSLKDRLAAGETLDISNDALWGE